MRKVDCPYCRYSFESVVEVGAVLCPRCSNTIMLKPQRKTPLTFLRSLPNPLKYLIIIILIGIILLLILDTFGIIIIF